MSKEHFSTGGRIPQIDDRRVKFFKGSFEETLPDYDFPNHDVLVGNLDADLHSSTMYLIRKLKDHVVPGTFIYFDEFSHMEPEFRAFNEFMSETGMKFSLVGMADSAQDVVFRREE